MFFNDYARVVLTYLIPLRSICSLKALETAASKYSKAILTAGLDSSITFKSQIIDSIGNEPKLIGAIFNKANLKYSKLTNAWVSFVVGSSLLLKEEGKIDVTLLFTHCHYDHIAGLPFFLPLYSNKSKLTIWTGHLAGAMTTKGMIDDYMRKPFFPIGMEYCMPNSHS